MKEKKNSGRHFLRSLAASFPLVALVYESFCYQTITKNLVCPIWNFDDPNSPPPIPPTRLNLAMCSNYNSPSFVTNSNDKGLTDGQTIFCTNIPNPGYRYLNGGKYSTYLLN